MGDFGTFVYYSFSLGKRSRNSTVPYSLRVSSQPCWASYLATPRLSAFKFYHPTSHSQRGRTVAIASPRFGITQFTAWQLLTQ